MKVLFVRHGKDDDRYRGGWSSLDLIPEGIEQAKRLAKHIKGNNCDYNIKISLTDDELKMLKSVIYKKKTTKTVRNRCQRKADVTLSDNSVRHLIIEVPNMININDTVH